jgi:hypothetical protein
MSCKSFFPTALAALVTAAVLSVANGWAQGAPPLDTTRWFGFAGVSSQTTSDAPNWKSPDSLALIVGPSDPAIDWTITFVPAPTDSDHPLPGEVFLAGTTWVLIPTTHVRLNATGENGSYMWQVTGTLPAPAPGALTFTGPENEDLVYFDVRISECLSGSCGGGNNGKYRVTSSGGFPFRVGMAKFTK